MTSNILYRHNNTKRNCQLFSALDHSSISILWFSEQNKNKQKRGGGGGGGILVRVYKYNQNMTFYYIYWTNGSFAAKLSLMVGRHNPKCPVKMIAICSQTWYCDIPSQATRVSWEKNGCSLIYLEGCNHGAVYNQNVSIVFKKILILLLPRLGEEIALLCSKSQRRFQSSFRFECLSGWHLLMCHANEKKFLVNKSCYHDAHWGFI